MSDTMISRAAETSSPPGNHPSGDNRFELVDKHLKRGHYAQDQLIETLHVAQDVFGYLSEDLLIYVARALRLPPSMVYGVATFYELFTFEPPGDHTCTVCTGTACYVKGADDIVRGISERYDVPAGATSADRSLTLKTARCLGSCGLAPVVVLDGDVMSHQTVEATLARVTGAVGGGS
ncbi:MAG: bidirectional hydrogenase complex protein HoxE [Acidimicrobiia bacterium]